MVQHHGNGHGGNGDAHDYLHEFLTRQADIVRAADDSELFKVKLYVDAATTHLMDDNGEIDYNRLKNPETLQAMAAQIGSGLTSRALTVYQADPNLPWHRQLQLTIAYAGLAGGDLKRFMESDKEDFTVSRIGAVSANVKRQQLQQMAPSTWEHIPDTPAAKASILNAMGIAGKLNSQVATLESIVELMQHYHGNSGVISPKTYERNPAYIQPAAPHAGN